MHVLGTYGYVRNIPQQYRRIHYSYTTAGIPVPLLTAYGLLKDSTNIVRTVCNIMLMHVEYTVLT